jgi:hypothetical protein
VEEVVAEEMMVVYLAVAVVAVLLYTEITL